MGHGDPSTSTVDRQGGRADTLMPCVTAERLIIGESRLDVAAKVTYALSCADTTRQCRLAGAGDRYDA